MDPAIASPFGRGPRRRLAGGERRAVLRVARPAAAGRVRPGRRGVGRPCGADAAGASSRPRGGERAGAARPPARLPSGVGAPHAARHRRGRPAAGPAGPGRPLHRTGQPDGVVSGPSYRPDDRRVRQHADVVHRGHAQHPRRHRAGVLHDGGGRPALRRAAPHRQVPRPDGTGRVRRSRLRDYALHQRLRQPAAQHRPHRRSDRVPRCSPIRAR